MASDAMRKVLLGAFFGFLLLCYAGGGASRADVTSLLYVRPAAILAALLFCLCTPPARLAAVRAPLIFLSCLAGIIILQLIPLPPAIWQDLPGHARLIEAANAAGIAQPWRPITLSPDATLNSLVSLTVPLAALVGTCWLGARYQALLLTVLLAGGAVSAAVAILQVAMGPASPLYLYRITNAGAAVGLFANRNHQALLLCCLFPMLAVWASPLQSAPDTRKLRQIMAIGAGLLLIPLIILTGSRAGLVFGAVGILAALWLYFRAPSTRLAKFAWPQMALIGLAATSAVLLGLFSASFSSITAFRRFTDLNLESDSRYAFMDTFLTMARDYLPFGSGFGTFEALYSQYEPLSVLRPSYLNHAHNDLLELLITAGIPGALLLLAFLAWVGLRAFRVLTQDRSRKSSNFSALSVVLIVMIMGGSLVDYPLRTPLIAIMFAIACGWLSFDKDIGRPRRRT